MTVMTTRDQVPQIVRTAVAASPRPGAAAPAGLTGRDILRILRKRKWLIILSVLITGVVVFAGTLLWYLFAPLYTAAAFIKVEPPKGTALGRETTVAPTDFMERQMATYANLVRSERVLRDATEDPKLRETGWYRKHQKNTSDALYDMIAVAPVTGQDFIRMSATDFAPTERDRGELADLVNAVANAAVKHVKALQNAAILQQISSLDLKQREYASQLERVRSELKEQGDQQVDSIQVLSIELANIATEKRMAENQQKQATWAAEQLDKLSAEELVALPGVRMMIDSDYSLQNLRRQETEWKLAVDRNRQKFGPDHRFVKESETSLENTRREIGDKEGQLAQKAVVAYKSQMAQDLKDKTARLEQAQGQYEERKTRMSDLQKKIEVQERKKNEEISIIRNIDALSNKIMDLTLIVGSEQLSLAKSAEVPREPSHPKWAVMMPLGVFLGLLIGLGFTFLLEFVDTSIKSPSELSRRTDLPLLGMVPHTDDLEEEIEDVRLAFMTNPGSLISEAFRHIRTGLLFSGPAGTRRSLLVTSSLPQDGRSTVALNLGASVARGGHKALVIDANFRQPMIQKVFPGCPEGGLSSALVGQVRWREMVHEAEPNLCLLSSGPMPPNPAELLGSEQMRQLLAEMAEEFDQVILDGAPCLLVTDSPVLATLVDGVVLVVRAGSNTYGVVQKSREMLTRIGAHVLGVVLNAVRVTAGGYLRKNYDAFYAYHEQPQLEAKKAD